MPSQRLRRHGADTHGPGGSDPNMPGPYHNIGAAGEADFVNGFNMAPTVEIPNPVEMRYRIVTGQANVLDETGAIFQYIEKQLELEGDVDGVSPGDVVFVLPPEHRKDRDLPVHTHDTSGIYVPCRLLATGEFIYGVP